MNDKWIASSAASNHVAKISSLQCLLFRIIGKDTLNTNLTLFKVREFNKKAKRRAKPRKPRKAHD